MGHLADLTPRAGPKPEARGAPTSLKCDREGVGFDKRLSKRRRKKERRERVEG